MRSFVRDIFSQGVVQALLVLRSLVVIPILTTTLGEISYGIWSQIIITITLLASVVTLRFDIVVVRFFSTRSQQRELPRAFYSMLLAILGMVGVVGMCFWAFAREISVLVFDDADLQEYSWLLFALLALRTLFIFFLAFYRSQQQLVRYSVIQSAQLMGEIMVLMGSLVFWQTTLVTALNILAAFNGGVVAILFASIAMRLGKATPRLSSLKPYLLFSLPLVPNVALQWAVNFSDRYVIVHLLSLEQAAIYAAIYTLGNFIMFFNTPISFVLYPRIAQYWEEENLAEVRFWMENSLKLFLLLSIPAVPGIYYIAPQMLLLLGSEQYAANFQVVFWISAGFLMMGVYQIYLYLLHLQKRTVSQLVIFITVAGINLGLNLLLVPYLGIAGAAIATAGSYLLQAALVYRECKKGFHVNFLWWFGAKAILSAAVMFGVLQLYTPLYLWQLTLMIVLGTGIYFVMMFLLRALGRREMVLFRQLLPK